VRGSSRPSVEAQMKFQVLMEIYDTGRSLDTKARADLIARFLAVCHPGIERTINWGFLFKGSATRDLVDIVHWGLDELRAGRAFLREKPSKILPPPRFQAKFNDGIQWDRDHSRIVRVGAVSLKQVYLTRIFELLTEVAPWLRVCHRSECGRFFLYQRPKQIYCGEACAQRVRMERFLAQRASSSQKG